MKRKIKRHRKAKAKKKNFLPMIIVGLVMIILGGGLLFFVTHKTKAASGRESTYDEKGFVVNWSKSTNLAKDQGDSCFFMGLQALDFCLNKQYSKALALYKKCEKIDFYRHPSFYKKDTSFDMMVIWDYVALKFPQSGIKRPAFHYRVSQYWDGRYRENWMFSASTVKPQVDYMKSHVSLGEDFYKNDLLMLKIGTSLALKNDASLRSKAGDYLKTLEEKTKVNGKIIPNLFFRYILGAPISNDNINACFNYWFPQGSNGNAICEWIFQRDPKSIDLYRNRNADTQFHFEIVNGKKMTLSEQFIEAIKK